MIVIVNMKCPDALHYACQDATDDKDVKKELERAISDNWMPCGEYLRVKFDTDKGTAEVIPNH